MKIFLLVQIVRIWNGCDISWCMSITENGIRNLAESCPKLTVFKAEGCTHVR